MSDFSRFFSLLKMLPYADKETIVSTYSGGKTASLREFKKLDAAGFRYMLADLENKVSTSPNPKREGQDDTQEEGIKRRFRSLILRAMQEQGVTVKNRDWSDVNAFVERYAGKGKSLSNMSLDELKRFNSQVHKLLDWHNAKKEQKIYLSIMN